MRVTYLLTTILLFGAGCSEILGLDEFTPQPLTDDGGTSPSGGMGGALATGGSGGANTDAGSATGGTPGSSGSTSVGGTQNGGGTSGSDAGTCAPRSIETTSPGVDLYIVLDDSGSMGEDCELAGAAVDSHWCKVIHGLAAYFEDEANVGLGVALNFFNNGYDCSSALGLARPPEGNSVAMTELPTHLSQLRASLDEAAPTGGTPTSAAMVSIATYTSELASETRRIAGVLITDGKPLPCGGNAEIKATARTLLDTTGIPVFMIGIDGADFVALDDWAETAGSFEHSDRCGVGTACYAYDGGGGEGVASALSQIASKAATCSYRLSEPVNGPEQLRVSLTLPNEQPRDLTRVSDKFKCSQGDWYFDDNVHPTTIEICRTSCGDVAKAGRDSVVVLEPCSSAP
ncbi:MAG: hypothetical protein R3B07_21305 [Polyangiaceae bacterium]